METCALLTKLSDTRHHVDVTINMSELDSTKSETKATYNEIRDWVQDNYGCHVTNLNIAQVKRKYGIIERQNHNLPRSPISKQPGCPSEKVEAIIQALKHFQMIE